MKFAISTSTTAAAFLSLAIPVCLSAQDAVQHHNPKHHHYKVVEMGTFGGPTSSIYATGAPPKFIFNKILTRSGAMLAGADTPIADPDEFAGPWVNYAFRWEDGIQSNLGVLPQRPRAGAQAPCYNCPWSTFAFSIAENGFVAGQSLHNAVDPLTGSPAALAVLWRDRKIVNLGTLGGYESGAAAVNRRGDVVGAALNMTPESFPPRVPYYQIFIYGYGTESHAFLWRDGTMRDLGTLGGPDSAALFVNEKGRSLAAATWILSRTSEPDARPFTRFLGAWQDA